MICSHGVSSLERKKNSRRVEDRAIHRWTCGKLDMLRMLSLWETLGVMGAGFVEEKKKTYRIPIIPSAQPLPQPSPHRRLQDITRQARPDQDPDVATQIQARARNRHLRRFNGSGDIDKGGGEGDTHAEAARGDEEGFPDVGVAAPEEGEERVAKDGGEGADNGEGFVGCCSVGFHERERGELGVWRLLARKHTF